jgi:glycine C-acetyltransferase
MKAIVKARPVGGREGTELRDVPAPKPGSGEAVVRVLASGLCGSDRHIYNWTGGMDEHIKLPRIYGHEFCGEVAELGPDVKGHLAIGDYVSAEMHVTCGRCYLCRTGQGHVCQETKILGIHDDGCFAEYVKVPVRNVLKLDRTLIPPRVGAFLDALGNAVHVAFEFPFTGRSVAVTGYGPIGAMAASIAHMGGAGALHITEISPFALERAHAWKKSAGADYACIYDTSQGGGEAVAAIRESTRGGTDLLWEMSGDPQAINDGLRMLRPGGVAVLLGLPKDPRAHAQGDSGAPDVRDVAPDARALRGRPARRARRDGRVRGAGEISRGHGDFQRRPLAQGRGLSGRETVGGVQGVREVQKEGRAMLEEKAEDRFRETLKEIRSGGLWKEERVLTSPQGAGIHVETPGGVREVLNFCANNYLGLANHPRLLAAARRGLASHGLGLASVRFICGTQDMHKALEERLSEFLRTDDTILYTSCFDANGGLFETLLGAEDAVISDELNHASIIDGIRLCKAERRRFKHLDMDDLERHLKETRNKRTRLVATDGVFSMDGDVAPLKDVCDLAEKYGALVMVDDSHATGFMGEHGRGAPELCGVEGRVDVLTSTLGKAMGGASGGFTTGRREIIALLRQRSRPYLFSNTLAPALVAASIEVVDLLRESTALRDKLEENTKIFRRAMTDAGFPVREGVHPIVPVMLGEFQDSYEGGDAKLAQDMAAALLEEGIYVIGFSYPVVPRGAARIRVQISAAHEKEHLDRAVAAFVKVGKKFNVVR